jgi:hypothetical protein
MNNILEFESFLPGTTSTQPGAQPAGAVIAGGAPVQLHPIELALQALPGRREGAVKAAPA